MSRRTASCPSAEERDRYHALIRAHGAHAVSFLGLESGMRFFFDEGGAVAYADTGRAWVAAGAPVASPRDVPALARAFVEAARAARRRACFFWVEGELLGEDFQLFTIGEQPLLDRESWRAAKASHRRLREQLRRARAKGVTARAVEPEELAEGAPLRLEVERLERAWLAARPMPEMGFVATVEPFVQPGEHRYLVAERAGHAVLFMSCVPIYARSGWLVEDVLRDSSTPNGTAELVFDRLFEGAVEGEVFTQGLSPLSGDIAPWLVATRYLTRPLYNFQGLRAFKGRLHPTRWERVSLAVPRGASTLLAIYDSLSAFARGSFTRFSLRLLGHDPGKMAWLLGVPLIAWTVILALLVVVDDGHLLGWGRLPLFGWMLFDLLLALSMLRVARAPRWPALLLLTAFASCDAALSLLHLALRGLGSGALERSLRALSAGAPVFGALALAYASASAARRATALRAST